MSSDPSDKNRLKCNVDGAGDYFIEPIESDHIESIWRHTPPQREEKNIIISSSPIPYLQAEENNRNPESLATINSGHFLPEIERSIDDEVNKHLNGLTVSCSNSKVSKRRREAEPQPQPPHVGSEGPEQYTTAKKQRLIWTQDLHSIFTTAVKNLTVEKAVPKKILEYMRGQGVIELTRENVASHLQKYRLFLRRKENDEKLSNLNSQSVSLNGSKQSNFMRSSPSDQISYHIENNSNCCSNPHFPLQNFSEHERSHIISNHAIDNVVPSLDQNRFFDQNMLHHSLHLTQQQQQQQRLPLPAQDRSCYVHHGGTVSSFQAIPSSFAPSTTPNMVPFSEIQRNDVLTMQNLQLKSEPMVQPLNGDDSLFEDISHPQFLSDHYFNVDENGSLAPVKINSGGISVLCNDFFQGHHTNFIEDYENPQFDRFVNTPESNFSPAFYYDHPTTTNSTLEMEMTEFEQNRRTNFNPSNNNPPDNASM